jgi:hypothetical protein
MISPFLLTMKRQSFRNVIFSRSTLQNIIKSQILSGDTAANLCHVVFSLLEKIFAIPKQDRPALRLCPDAQPFNSQNKNALRCPAKNLHLQMFWEGFVCFRYEALEWAVATCVRNTHPYVYKDIHAYETEFPDKVYKVCSVHLSGLITESLLYTGGNIPDLCFRSTRNEFW